MYIGIEAQRILRPKKHGMDVVALELIKNLQAIDKENDYVIFCKDDEDNEAISETANFKIEKFSALSYADWEQIMLKKKANSKNLNILHCTANTAPLSIATPLLITIHDIIYLENIDFKGTAYQNLGNLYRRYIVPKVARNAELILTVSEFERENIINRLKISDKRVEVLYNGVSSNFNEKYTVEEVNAFRNRYQLPENYIMFLGNTAPKKNTINALKAYVDYCLSEKDAIPLVLLDYKKELVIKLLQELKQEPLINQVFFPGYVPYSQIPLMYNAATLFLYPSLRESFGLPILEAMACGTPVITSSTSSMPEIAGGAAMLINPHNHLELADAIRCLLKDDVLRKNYIEKGLKRAKEFTWKSSAEKLLSIYQSFK